MLILATMVESLQSMYVGDRIRLYVGQDEVDVWGFEFDDVVCREDAGLRRIARELEHCA